MEKLVSLKDLLEKEDKAVKNYNMILELIKNENERFENNREEYIKIGLLELYKKNHNERINKYNKDLDSATRIVEAQRRKIKDYFLKLD